MAQEEASGVTDANAKAISEYVENSWKGDDGVLETLKKYIAIPNQSPDYDPNIHTNGYQEQVVDLMVNWVKAQNVENLKIRVFKNGSETGSDEKNEDAPRRTPLIFMELPATDPKKYTHTVLMYGHFDKQPPLENDWDKENGLGPYTPVIKDGKLYGRGGADDGYAIFASIDSIKALQKQKMDYPRIIILIEGSEESGSPDLPYYVNLLKQDMGNIDYVICLDSGAMNYEQLWLTSSLRGIIIGYLKVQLLKEGIHSGASGIVRDSFHVIRELLDRIDNYSENGGTMLKELHVEIPKSHIEYAQNVADALGEQGIKKIPFLNDQVNAQIDYKQPNGLRDILLNGTWKPQLTITGIDGMPDLKGGNVLRKFTTLKLSIRVPPSMKIADAQKVLEEAILKKPLPFNAHVEFDSHGHTGEGFVCPEMKPWLQEGVENASKTYFNKTALFMAEGGSIPLMGNLLNLFPSSQFIVTGILGPGANAHGPNEFLHIDFTKKVTMCVANILNTIAIKHDSK